MRDRLLRIFPLFKCLGNYQKSFFVDDLSAGLTVAVMLVPQGMAYAMLAGLPPILGLYASIVPLLIYAVFGTSKQLAVGPTAIMSLMTAAAVGGLAEVGTDMYLVYAVMLALMVGLIQLAMGLARFGFMVNFLSHPVVSGFTSGAAIIIGVSQLKHLLGIDIPRSIGLNEMLASLIDKLGGLNYVTFALGLSSIALLLLLKRWKPQFPGALLVVVISTSIVWFFELAQFGVKIVGAVPAGLPEMSFPKVELDAVQSLLPAALIISMVGFLESISVAKAMARKQRDEINPNQELLGLGLANIVGSLFKSFPVTGGFARTAVNAEAGAKTVIASIITAIFIAIVLIYLTPLFYFLPNAVLAAIIMTAVMSLVDWREVRHLYKVKKSDLILLLITFFATLVLGIEAGILLGVGSSLLWFIIKTTKPHTAVLGRIPETKIYRNVQNYANLELEKGILILRIDAQFYFGNANFLKQFINAKMDQQEDLKAIIIEAASINQIDSSAEAMLNEICEDIVERGVVLYFANVKKPVMNVMQKSGFDQKLGLDHFFLDLHSAVVRARGLFF